jgi:hypothetical protein
LPWLTAATPPEQEAGYWQPMPGLGVAGRI